MPRRSDNEPALPGMEAMALPASLRPGDADMTDEKVFTAAVLFKDHPDVFKSVCIARFKHALPVSWISEILKVSEHTVRAIEAYVLESPSTDATRAAFFIKSGVNRSRKLANRTAIELLRRRMEERPESLSVADIISIVEATKDQEEHKQSVNKQSEDVIDVELIDSFDTMLNGLETEKKDAREDQVGESENQVPSREESVNLAKGDECSTESCEKVSCSMEKSDNIHMEQGANETLCNSLSKIGKSAETIGESAETVPENGERVPADRRDTPIAENPSQGRGGTPAGGARGGSTINVS